MRRLLFWVLLFGSVFTLGGGVRVLTCLLCFFVDAEFPDLFRGVCDFVLSLFNRGTQWTIQVFGIDNTLKHRTPQNQAL